mgnify:CR=1 FL=1
MYYSRSFTLHIHRLHVFPYTQKREFSIGAGSCSMRLTGENKL